MNIIYIHTHDTGKVISPYGHNVPTPNYQEFCQDSVLFQQAFCVAPTCSPSRAGLLTGVYPHQNGMLGLAQRGFNINRKMHIANILFKNGYNTALCGVQHEIGYYTNHEKAIGTIGYQQDLSADNTKYSEKDLVIWDRENANNLKKWLENYKSKKPFFVSFGMHSTHRQYPDEIDETISDIYSQPLLNLPNTPTIREDFAKFKTTLKMADENLGIIIKTLKDCNLYENTIIILTTDHGLANPFEKCTLNDAGIGVLLAIRVPNSNPMIKTYDGLISHIDIVPTILDLISIEKPYYLEGNSFASLFKGENFSENEEIYAEINFHTSYEPVRCVRTKRFKYIKFFDTDYLKINKSNIDNSSVKEFYMDNGLDNYVKPNEQLFDLYYDVFETNNLSENPDYAGQLEIMRKKLNDFMIKTNDPLLLGQIPLKKEWKVNKKDCYSAGSKNPEDYESLGEV